MGWAYAIIGIITIAALWIGITLFDHGKRKSQIEFESIPSEPQTRGKYDRDQAMEEQLKKLEEEQQEVLEASKL